MADTVPGDASTTASITVGSGAEVVIDTLGDHDWYAVTLTAGTSYVIQTWGQTGSNADSYLRLYSGGNVVAENDDIVPGDIRTSLLTYTPTVTGTFYVDAGTYENQSTGAFRVSVAAVGNTAIDTVGGTVATAASFAVNSSVVGTINSVSDHDVYAINLVAGETYFFRTSHTSLGDSLDSILTLRDAAGNQLKQNDDAGASSYSGIRFTATSSGTYYLDVSSFNSASNPGAATGNYNLTAYRTDPLAYYSNDQIAHQLTHDYWGGTAHHFAVTTGASLTFNLTALTAAGQYLAQQAINLWSDVTGITFTPITTAGAQILFDDAEEGAFAQSSYNAAGAINSSSVNVSAQWLIDYGSTLNSYSFQAYVHEIGHALGLGHAGNYNSNAAYEIDATYLNDSWGQSVMSYFSQTENSWTAAQGWTRQYVLSPMVADIIAMNNLYGMASTTRTGNTTYGFNNTSGRDVYNSALNPNVSYTVIDNGGVDTLDYSGFGANQIIDLRQEMFSNVGGRVGNVSIARGTVVENAIGGSGHDTLIGNSANNILNGGGGSDRMEGGSGNDIYYVENTGDIVVEYAGGGIDTVYGIGLVTLAAEVENLILLGDTPFDGTGNNLGNQITGNSSNNILDGAGGNDILTGGLGPDRLTGGSGADIFFYTSTADSPTNLIGAGDTITDFSVTEDKINLTMAGGAYFIGAAQFSGVAGQVRAYAASNGVTLVELDSDGNKVADLLVTLNNAPALTLSNFVGLTAANTGINGTPGNDVLTGTANDDIINGLAGDDILRGGAGNDTLDGGAGADRMEGGAGNDIYYVDNSGDVVVELANEGTDRVLASIYHILADNVENLEQTGTSDINGVGNALNNIITGNSGSNMLYGGAGGDTLYGGNGDDWLHGDEGNDILDGQGGYDHMFGGLGNDVYYLRDDGDMAIEYANEGLDTVYIDRLTPGAVFTLGDNFENGALFGTGYALHGNALNNSLYGNGYDNLLTGGAGLDLLSGGAGNDTLDGGTGIDRMLGGAGNDIYYVDNANDSLVESANGGTDTINAYINYTLLTDFENLVLLGTANLTGTGNAVANSITGNSGANNLYGLAGNDMLMGGAGHDVLDGGLGADIMSGGDGNDVMIVDNAGDVTIGGTGRDRAEASVSYSLGAEMEDLTLTGTAAINGTGNALANQLTGNGAANILRGGDGGDVLLGGDGNDSLYGDTGDDNLVGGAGNDILDGGLGADRMAGGAGNDIYYANVHADVITELANEGLDTVYVGLTAAGTGTILGANIENAIMQGIGNIFVRGNELNNQIAGNGGSNWLYGEAGNDTLSGQGGMDWIVGGSGNDMLFGGYHADTFIFASGSGTDIIRDFERGLDKIDLSAFGLTYAQLQGLFVQNGVNGEIHMTTGETIILANIQTGQLGAGDFIL